MSELTSANWSETAASNNAAAPNGWPEGMNPSDVNNAAREGMSALKKLFNRISGTYTAGGGTTAYTLTPTVAIGAYADEIWSWIMPSTNAATATMNISGLGARNIQKLTTAGYADVADGDMPSGAMIQARYSTSASKFYILSVTAGADFNINGLTADTTPNPADYVPTYDVSATSNKKALVSDIFKALNLLTEDTGPDVTADFGLTYDASATAVKKVLLRNFGQVIDLTAIDVTGASAADIVLDTTNHRALLIFFDAIVLTSDGAQLLARVSTDGGSTFLTTATYNHARGVADSTPTFGGTGNVNDTAIVVAANVDSTTSQNLSGFGFLLIGGAAAHATKLFDLVGHVASSGVAAAVFGYGSNSTASQVNGLRFVPSTSTFASGFIRPYAILK
jgi:hypothetical protein